MIKMNVSAYEVLRLHQWFRDCWSDFPLR